MADVRWLIRTRQSAQVIITAPDAPVGVGAAVERLEAALDGYAGPKPAWFRALERLGYWWYAICMAATAAVFAAAAPNGVALNIAYGLGSGIAVAVVSGGLIAGAAHVQTRLTSGRTAQQTIAEAAPLARPAGSVADRVEAVLAWDPSREHEVHRLAWDAAEAGRPNRRAADEELDDLWRRADPEAAAAREATLRRIRAGLERPEQQ
ncbi:hypothetical protein [Glycomyces albidus]|uniref:Uncharacterized protein n=1 Tax=Glycomyces albidus TaxID=2656774 RepID=A0A6L5GEH5_9ACTN|nr:hypothetical protein [Glycomyces albidus]MQM28114.1 hypothetical protein [Glycomyces albidus]